MDRKPIERAIRVAGSVKALAEAAGVRPQAISQWKRIPADRVRAIAEATKLTPRDLRPDLFGEVPA